MVAGRYHSKDGLASESRVGRKVVKILFFAVVVVLIQFPSHTVRLAIPTDRAYNPSNIVLLLSA